MKKSINNTINISVKDRDTFVKCLRKISQAMVASRVKMEELRKQLSESFAYNSDADLYWIKSLEGFLERMGFERYKE